MKIIVNFQYYSELIKKEECATVFTNEAAIFYFIKKQSCSKYYFMWSSSPVVIQRKSLKILNTNHLIYSL